MAGSGDEIIIRSEKIYKVGARRERSPPFYHRVEQSRDRAGRTVHGVGAAIWLPFMSKSRC
jgi:hypothetical protein